MSSSNMSTESKAAKEQGVCFDWLKGKCKRGDQCKYKHEKPTMPAAPSPSPSRKKTPCKFFLKGTCNKGSDCPFSHEKPRKSSKDGRRRTPDSERKNSRDKGRGSDRKRSSSGSSSRRRRRNKEKDNRRKRDTALVRFRCHSSDDDASMRRCE
eukprot:2942344-Amphidinium_carterae.3